MGKLFDSVKLNSPKFSKFDLSHERKMSMNMGQLVPMLVQEVLPGDKFRVNTEVMMRMAPMLAPIMHRVNVKIDYFNVPIRLVWDEYEPFFTGGEDGLAVPVAPTMTTTQMITPGGGFTNFLAGGKLPDYMGLPNATLDEEPQLISALPFRAYQTIHNEYYRDQTLQSKIETLKTSGPITDPEVRALCQIRHCAWEKDYFTSALPFAQRGPAVNIPIDIEGDAPLWADPIGAETSAVLSAIGQPGSTNIGYGIAGLDPTIGGGDIVARLSGLASSTTITELRRSVRLQEWLEKMATAGARYVEQLRSMWKVKPQDARFARPEYLGGGRAAMSISEVLSSVQQVDEAGEPIGTPQGDMAGHGFSIGNQNGFTYSVKEHGYIIGIIRVLPKTAYQQGIPRHFQRFDRFDYAWPQFAQIGEQEIKYKEIFYDGATGHTHEDDETWGYQSRYAEYKYGCSTVHGEFRTNLSFWHMGRIFETQPELNDGFVEADPTTRIFAVEDSDSKLYVHLYNKIDALRPLPYFGTPQL